MTRSRLIAFAVCTVVAIQALMAQTDAFFSQFYQLPTLYNPAAVGQTDFVRLRGAGRLQWVGIDGAPQTFVVTADSPFKLFNKRLGAGLVMRQESIGLYKSMNLDAQIAYKLRKFGGEWTAALSVGMYDQRFRGSDVFIPDGDDFHEGTDDAIPTTDLHGTALDLGAGIWYERKNWRAGVSVTHLTSPTIRMGGENGGTVSEENIYEFQAPRTLYFMGECNIPVKNTLFEIVPSLMVQTDFTFTTAQIMGRARYNKFLSFGVGYRYNDAVIATVAAEIKNFYVGYSYDYATSAIHSASSGSHEIVAGYSLKLDLGEKNKNRHKNIRLM